MVLTKKNYFQRTTRPKGPRTNDRIRAPEVQVISSDKKHLGTFPIKEAVEPKAIKTREKFGKHFATSSCLKITIKHGAQADIYKERQIQPKNATSVIK